MNNRILPASQHSSPAPCRLQHGLRAAAIAQTFFAAGAMSANAQENDDDKAVDLDAVTVKGDNFALSSPKFTVPLKDTPQTINVIPSGVIEAQGATSLQDVLRNSPGITFRAGEGGAAPGDNLFIRGFSAENDIFVNGVRDRGEYSRDAYNLEQVEVSKGPASATYGRGSTGGSVNLVTKQARMGDTNSVTASIGTDAYRRLTFDANRQLDAERGIAFRLTGMASENDVPGRDFVNKSAWALNPSLSFGLGKDTQVTLSYEKLKQDDLTDYGLWTGSFGNPDVPYSNYYGYPDRDFATVDNDRFALSVGHQFANGISLRNVTTQYTSRQDGIYTAPAGPNNSTEPGYIRTSDKIKDKRNANFSNQTTIGGGFETAGIRHSISSGLELSREKLDNYGRVGFSPDPARNEIDPQADGPFVFTGGERDGSVRSTRADTVALFLFDTLTLSEKWQANVGLRWERFDTDYAARQDDETTSALDHSETMASYRAGLVYKPNRYGSFYLGLGNSFNPSAENFSLSDSSTSANNIALDPEETRTYELGTKWDLLDHNLSLSAAAFRSDKFHARARLGGSGTDYTLLGSQIVEGFELGVSGRINEKLSLFGGYSVMSSEIEDSPNVDEIGAELAYTPSQSFNLWADYAVSEKLSIGAGVQHSGSQAYSATADAPADASYWLVDATASYQLSEQLSLRLNIDNVTDERYIERGSSNRSVPGAARSAKLTANYQF